MPTVTYFNKYPTFPKDVPVAELPRVSLASLVAGDDAESAQLFRACKETGFVLVDLRGSGEGETMLKDAEAAFDLSEMIFDTDQAELMRYAFKPPEGVFGYVYPKIFSVRLTSDYLCVTWVRLEIVTLR